MVLARASVVRIGLALLLLHTVGAVVISHDNSAVCQSIVPQCEAKCKGQDYIFVCAAGNGPMGTPYVICRCANPAPPVGGPQQIARLTLTDWPGAQACNQKTWANDCTTQMTALVNGTSVTLSPATSAAFNEQCSPAPGIVIGPKGSQAAVVFPQYPIGITSTGPDGSVTIDFSQTAADDPNQNDWSKCILTYKVIQGTFLDPRAAIAAQNQAGMQQQLLGQQQLAGAGAGAGTLPGTLPGTKGAAAATDAGGAPRPALLVSLAVALVAAAVAALH